MTIDKELLFKPRLPEEDVELPGVGTVRVRALNRGESLKIGRSVKSEADAARRIAQLERKIIAVGMVDPVLTEDEVARWQEASPAGELTPVVEKIQELSGMTPGAAKEAYKAFDEDPNAEFRLPSR